MKLTSVPRRVIAGLCVLGVAGAGSAWADDSHGSVPVVRQDGISAVNVTRSNAHSSGEPEIAVNPTNADNLVYVSTYYRYTTVSGHRTPYNPLLPTSMVEGFEHCFVAFSTDGGATWTPGMWPNGDRPYCGDPMIGTDSAGNFYISMDWMGNAATPVVPPGDNQGVDGDIGVISSRDGGRTWSRYGTSDVEPTATGTQVDRPFSRVDPVTGTIYVESGITSRTLAVSSDHGITWSAPVPFPGNHLAAYDGLLATAVQSGQTSAFGGGIAAPSTNPTQLTFEVSNNEGRTFASYPVTDSGGRPVTGGTGDYISADPSQVGRFAIMQLDPSGTAVDVYVADVAGAHVTFSGPARVSSPPGAPSGMVKPWMDFGGDRTGALGVMWKTTDTSDFAVFAAVSTDHGTSFSTPLQVNQTSAAEDANQGDGGDDLSWITVDDTDTYIGWGQIDPAENALNGYFAKVPLTAYPNR